jgi:hypothetical protein
MKTATITLTSNADTFRNALASQEWSEGYAKGSHSLAATCHEVKDENTFEILESFATFKGGSYTLENNIKSMVQTMVEELGGDKKAGARAVARTLEALEYMENNNGAIAEMSLVFDADGAEVALEAGYDIEEEETPERSTFILNHGAFLGLIEQLNCPLDPWHASPREDGTAVDYSNIIYLSNYPVHEDYPEDWNKTVAYRDDSGAIYNQLEATFTVSALGFPTSEALDEFGELTEAAKAYNRSSARYLVECPRGKVFAEIWEPLQWLKDSIFESYGDEITLECFTLVG